MTRAGLALLLVFICSGAYSANIDSLVRWNELVYGTAAEKKILHDALKTNTDEYLRSFLGNAPDPEDSYKRLSERINSVLNDINGSGQLKKRNDKKIKYIEDIVRKRFLSNYESESYFFELMTNGNYNSLTLTALFACVFEKLSIPYHIVESPKDVSLVAYPESDKIAVNTNAPVFYQYRIYGDEFQEQYIKYLQSRSLVSQDEIDQYPTESLFNAYFFKDDSVSIRGLAGKHYIFDAYRRLDNKDFSGAYAQMLKGYMYYPSPKAAYSVMIATVAFMNQSNTNALTRATLLGRLSRFSNRGVKSEEIVGEFEQLSEELLIKYKDRSSFNKCYKAISEQVHDTTLLNQIKVSYYTQSARAYLVQGNYILAKAEAVHALDLKQGDEFLNNVFVSSLSASFYNIRSSKMIVDSVEFYISKYPLVAQSTQFMDMTANAYALDLGNSYTKGDVKRAEQCRQKFEELITAKKAKIPDENMVAFAYSQGATYYLTKGQKTKARELLDRGLLFIPGNSQLQQHRKLLN